MNTSLYYEHKVGPKEVRIRQFSLYYIIFNLLKSVNIWVKK